MLWALLGVFVLAVQQLAHSIVSSERERGRMRSGVLPAVIVCFGAARGLSYSRSLSRLVFI